MSLHEPLWLLLALLPLLFWLWGRSAQARQWRAIAEPQLLPWVMLGTSTPTGRWRLATLLLAWLLMCVALAGPRAPRDPARLLSQSERVHWVVLDLSRSMDATDALPSRRERAVSLLDRWLQRAPIPRVGLIVFAGQAHVVLPPTADRAALRYYLAQVRSLRLPTFGNDLAGALRHVHASASKTGGGVLLLTDGDMEPSARKLAVQQAQRLAAAGIAVDIVTIGKTRRVAVPTTRGWLEHQGRTVLTRVEPDWMSALVSTGGQVLADTGEADFRLGKWPGTVPLAGAMASDIEWHEHYQWPLAGAWLLLLVAAWRRPMAARFGMAATLGAVALHATINARANSPMVTAFDAYRAERYEQVKQTLAGKSGYHARMLAGAACYKLGEIDCAVRNFATAAWAAQADEDRGRAVFNLAQGHFRLGDFAQAQLLYRDAAAYGLETGQHERASGAIAQAVAERLAAQQRGRGRGPGGRPDRPDRAPTPDQSRSLTETNRLIDPTTGQTVRLEDLLKRGVQRASVAGQGGRTRPAGAARWVGTGQETAGPTVALLRRLFELEEGFPGPLDEPRERKGMRPW